MPAEENTPPEGTQLPLAESEIPRIEFGMDGRLAPRMGGAAADRTPSRPGKGGHAGPPPDPGDQTPPRPGSAIAAAAAGAGGVAGASGGASERDESHDADDGDRLGGQQLPRRLGNYELLAPIGHGGMAEVYVARHTGPMGFEKIVVVKCIHPHLAKERYFVDMFLDEARIAARINDPHVVQIYELGNAGGTLFMSMEYLAGETLYSLIKTGLQRNRPLEPRLAARIVADAAAGLHAAHELRDPSGRPLDVVHRDASPGNIVVLYGGGVKVVDFGVAKARGKLAQTSGGEVKGKFAYMSPEQILGEEVDRRSDVFSLGVVLWEALALRRLFRAENEATTVRLILEGTPPPPSRLRPDVPAELDRVALRALSKDRAQRYQTAEELRSALEACLAALGGQAGPMEVGAWMRDVFPERIQARTQLIERVSAASSAPFDATEMDAFFGGRESSSSNVVLEDEPGMDVVHRVLMEGKRARRRRTLVLGAVVALALLGLVGGALRAILTDPSEAGTGALPVTAMPVAGQARLTVRPADATLVLDGKELVGPGPYLLDDLDPGDHEVEASAPGFEPAKRKLEISVGKVASIEIALVALAPARLSVSTTPAGATVEVDGTPIGLTPFKLDALRPDVTHALRVTRDGFLPIEESILARPGEAFTRDYRLEPSKGDLPAKPTGRLYLSTTPWSIVYHGKRKLGETPLLGVRLPAGKLTLRAENPKTGQKKTFKVDIVKGKDTRMSITL